MKLELNWIDKNKNHGLERRVMLKSEKNSVMDSVQGLHNENMLIHGDNLLALKALEQSFTNKIKCIYIDPPYNTGSAFENYDDNLEHSIWLNLMYKRLQLLKKLLCEDSLIFIQIDDNEQAYLKVICDEIFGRNNFVNSISVKMSPSSGVKRTHKDKGFIKNKEYILVYKKGSPVIYPSYDEWEVYDDNYTIFFDNEIESLKDKVVENFPEYKNVKYKQYIHFEDLYSFLINNSQKIFRRHGPSKWAIENLDKGEILYEDETKTTRNKVIKVYNDDKSKFEYLMRIKSGNNWSYERLEPLSWNVIDNRFKRLRGDLWVGFEKDMGNVGKEGSVKLANSKKPERLIYDIISSCTLEGDYVLDSFLGSGTTSAVAHKMNRRWIGIELGEHAYSLSKARMDNVINGDSTGVSNCLNWKGGGGYTFYELAPTLLNEDEFGQLIINKEYNADMLASAIALHEGYKYEPSKDLYWKQSYINDNNYLYVTTNHVNETIINSILNDLNDENLLIVCKSFDSNCINVSRNIKIKKIPNSLIDKCKFGVDNYNLNIITPPVYEYDDECEEYDE